MEDELSQDVDQEVEFQEESLIENISQENDGKDTEELDHD